MSAFQGSGLPPQACTGMGCYPLRRCILSAPVTARPSTVSDLCVCVLACVLACLCKGLYIHTQRNMCTYIHTQTYMGEGGKAAPPYSLEWCSTPPKCKINTATGVAILHNTTTNGLILLI